MGQRTSAGRRRSDAADRRGGDQAETEDDRADDRVQPQVELVHQGRRHRREHLPNGLDADQVHDDDARRHHEGRTQSRHQPSGHGRRRVEGAALPGDRLVVASPPSPRGLPAGRP